jgi:hypothetical protein
VPDREHSDDADYAIDPQRPATPGRKPQSRCHEGIGASSG